jgi:hypothetical protein
MPLPIWSAGQCAARRKQVLGSIAAPLSTCGGSRARQFARGDERVTPPDALSNVVIEGRS